MSRFIAATLVGALALAACAPGQWLIVPQGLPAAPEPELSSGPALVPSAHFDNGYRMYEKGKYRGATRSFERALQDNPGDYSAAYMLGMSYLQRGRYYDARGAFRGALELAPDHMTASRIHAAMAYTFEAVRQTRMAHHHYHEACKAYKANPYAQAGAARTEYRTIN